MVEAYTYLFLVANFFICFDQSVPVVHHYTIVLFMPKRTSKAKDDFDGFILCLVKEINPNSMHLLHLASCEKLFDQSPKSSEQTTYFSTNAVI